MKILTFLSEKLDELLKVYISELSEFMDEKHLSFLQDESDPGKFIRFSDNDSGDIGAWCINNKRIFFGRNTASFIEELQRNPFYGTNPEHVLVSSSNFVDNDLDYLSYMEHFILTGKQEIDFYLDILPHEAMHLIGISGGALGEGITEKRTREICLKHNIRCAPICHSKETKLVSMMEEIVGKDILTKAGFKKGFSQYSELEEQIDMKLGNGTFKKIRQNTEPIYYETYLVKKYKTPFDRFRAYRQLDFKVAYSLLHFE